MSHKFLAASRDLQEQAHKLVSYAGSARAISMCGVFVKMLIWKANETADLFPMISSYRLRLCWDGWGARSLAMRSLCSVASSLSLQYLQSNLCWAPNDPNAWLTEHLFDAIPQCCGPGAQLLNAWPDQAPGLAQYFPTFELTSWATMRQWAIMNMCCLSC